MRDPKRIPELLALVQECWETVPDWRFGQLIENFKRFSGKSDLFYLEDDDLMKELARYFNTTERAKDE